MSARVNKGKEAVGEPLPTALRSAAVVRFMGPWFERFFRRHLNGLRVARWGQPVWPVDAPVVVYTNHPAWWDVAVFAILSGRLFPEYQGYGPIEAAMLGKYGFFRRLGIFGIDLDSPRGAAFFLRASADILGQPRRLMWITAQGRFADARERPLGCRPGVARLAEIAPDAVFLPMAIEYSFWTERGAEALVAFGPAVPARSLATLDRRDRLRRLEEALAATMDRLAADAIARDPARFVPVLAGQAGIGGIYDAWRRLKALLQGRRFDPAHREPAA